MTNHALVLGPMTAQCASQADEMAAVEEAFASCPTAALSIEK